MTEIDYEPDHPDSAHIENLANALARGDMPTVVQTLRALAALDCSASKSALTLLADVFDDSPALRSLYPRRLKFVSRGPGKPPKDQMRQQGEDFLIALAVRDELEKSKKVDLAVEAVSKRFNRKKSTIYKARSKITKNSKAHSK